MTHKYLFVWNISLLSSPRAFLGRQPESDTIEFIVFFIHIIPCLIFSSVTTLGTPLENLDFVTAPETSQVNDFNNHLVNVIKRLRGRG